MVIGTIYVQFPNVHKRVDIVISAIWEGGLEGTKPPQIQS